MHKTSPSETRPSHPHPHHHYPSSLLTSLVSVVVSLCYFVFAQEVCTYYQITVLVVKASINLFVQHALRSDTHAQREFGHFQNFGVIIHSDVLFLLQWVESLSVQAGAPVTLGTTGGACTECRVMHVLSSVKLLSLAHLLELILVAACSAFHSLTLDSASFFFITPAMFTRGTCRSQELHLCEIGCRV